LGLEATCEARFAGKVGTGKAHLDAAELTFRGDFRLRIPLKGASAEAKKGLLTVSFAEGTASFALGTEAEKWALKIRYPRGRLEKLGIKPGSRVAVLAVDDPSFSEELKTRTDDVASGRPKKDTDVIVVGMSKQSDLARLTALRELIKSNGAIWVVWPKGRKEFREDDVRAHGPAAGLVDVKVMSFSDTLSGLKMVIPVKDR
jgi:hypothetical protein